MHLAGFTRQEILDMYCFIDWLLRLPEELEHEFEADLKIFEKEIHMTYVTSIEKRGMQRGLQRGMQQGMQQGMREDIKEVLIERFGACSSFVVDKLEHIDEEKTLRSLLRKAVRVSSLDIFSSELDDNV